MNTVNTLLADKAVKELEEAFVPMDFTMLPAEVLALVGGGDGLTTNL